MAKGGIGMVLAPEYSDNRQKKGKNTIETVMNSIEFPLLDRTTPNSVISTTLNDQSMNRKDFLEKPILIIHWSGWRKEPGTLHLF